MKGAQRVLHIRCGDDIRDKLVAAGIEGDYLSFADPAWLGPPPAFNAWLAGRAALIAERTKAGLRTARSRGRALRESRRDRPGQPTRAQHSRRDGCRRKPMG